jgi:hypothetical protein
MPLPREAGEAGWGPHELVYSCDAMALRDRVRPFAPYALDFLDHCIGLPENGGIVVTQNAYSHPGEVVITLVVSFLLARLEMLTAIELDNQASS